MLPTVFRFAAHALSVRRFSWVLGIAALLGGCQRLPTFSSRYLSDPIVVDVNTAEWPNELQYDRESRLQYQVLNDKATLYLRLVAADAATRHQVLQQGLTVWLDSTGRNRQQLGVHFPLGMAPGRGLRPVPTAGENDRPEPLAERQGLLLTNMREMELLHYRGEKEPLLTDTYSNTGVRVAAAVNAQGDLTYELAVPLRLLYAQPGPGARAVVGLSLEGGTRSAPSGTPSGGGRAGGRSGGTRGAGGMGGGRSGGGRGGSPSGERRGPAGSMPKALALKATVALATAP